MTASNPGAPTFALPVLVIVAVLVTLLPFLFGNAVRQAEQTAPRFDQAFACVFGIFAGGLINIPLKSVAAMANGHLALSWRSKAHAG